MSKTLKLIALEGCKVGDDLVPPGKIVEVEVTETNRKDLDILIKDSLAMVYEEAPAKPAVAKDAPVLEALPEPESEKEPELVEEKQPEEVEPAPAHSRKKK